MREMWPFLRTTFREIMLALRNKILRLSSGGGSDQRSIAMSGPISEIFSRASCRPQKIA